MSVRILEAAAVHHSTHVLLRARIGPAAIGGGRIDETIDLLRKNSAEAAAAIRALTDDAISQAAPVSLYSDAPLTCQFVLEDHAVRHSYHHLARIRAALKR
jgi:hypothetical protein